ncbi:MAG: hypothetical protein WB507_03700 [Solirubrobacterales bacterium]
MAGLPYHRFRETLNQLAADGGGHGYRVATVIDSDDCWLGTWANNDLYVIVQASLANPALDRTLIDVHAGSAYGARPAGELFEALATASWRFDYGGPWARSGPDGTAAYGWRSRLPSDLFSEDNLGEAFGFVLGMVDAFGHAAGTLAAELIPGHGGRRCSDQDPAAWPALLGGLLPPSGVGEEIDG